MIRGLALAALILLASGARAEDLPADRQIGPGASLSGDPSKGRLIFGTCRSCHAVEREIGHGIGPNLHRIFGKVAGTQAEFDYYSAGLQAAAFVWTPQKLDKWLQSPVIMVPDTTMMSVSMSDAQQRADLIAYFKQASVKDP
jgi:cytochrome c